MQHLSRNPFCSRPVDPLPDALGGSREDICFLHPCSLIHEANSVSLLSALCSVSVLCRALLFQLKPPRHAVGARPGAVIIMEVGMECPAFHCSDSALCLTRGWSPLACCGYHQLCMARKWLDGCVIAHTSTHTRALSPSLREWMARSGRLPFVLSKKL